MAEEEDAGIAVISLVILYVYRTYQEMKVLMKMNRK